jgi:hypothetical protein
MAKLMVLALMSLLWIGSSDTFAQRSSFPVDVEELDDIHSEEEVPAGFWNKLVRDVVPGATREMERFNRERMEQIQRDLVERRRYFERLQEQQRRAADEGRRRRTRERDSNGSDSGIKPGCSGPGVKALVGRCG